MPTSPSEAFKYGENELPASTEGPEMKLGKGYVGPEVAQKFGREYFEPVSVGPNAVVYKPVVVKQ